MKQLRKFLPVMLVMVLALGLFGCGSSSSEEEEPAAADTSASTSEEAEAAEESAEAVEYEHGTIDGTTYTSDFFGFTFTAKDGWEFSDEEALRQVNQSVSDVVDNDAVTEALKSGSTFIDMQATDTANPLNNVNLTVSYAPGSKGIGDVNDATISYMTKMYEDAGFTDVTITKSTATVAGEEIDALVTEMTVQGTSMVEKQVFFVSHDYLGTFTTSGISEEECDELLGWLSK